MLHLLSDNNSVPFHLDEAMERWSLIKVKNISKEEGKMEVLREIKQEQHRRHKTAFNFSWNGLTIETRIEPLMCKQEHWTLDNYNVSFFFFPFIVEGFGANASGEKVLFKVTRNPNWSTEILWLGIGYIKGKILSPLKRSA
ncbi:hypothetical protein NC651_021566 [Populus alba x Populus x berolinensis]|nr:hypothetical protein NC651_021566 [Populus alba x Populus x berolinensis]